MFTSVSNVVVVVVYRGTLSNKRTRLWLRVSRATKSGWLAVGPVNRVDQLFAELHLHEPLPNPVEREMMPHGCMLHASLTINSIRISDIKDCNRRTKRENICESCLAPAGQKRGKGCDCDCGRFPLLRMPLNCWAHAARILSKRCLRPPLPQTVPLHLDVLLKVSCYFHRPQT